MQIKRVESVGFKSFCDRVRVDFTDRITAVVGPNGCGKSNIVDALRWAMGEQSARHLRGKSMEDVIFNGSDTRGPSGLAEVTVTFRNDGRVPVEYLNFPEIAVTRRLHRDGTSEYLINKVPVRLMDITNIFLGTGVGTKAYSIIEQGRIGLIVSARPEDRRLFIEEAAGITKYQRRKKKAERHMDRTRQNLLRVSDVVEEIGKRLSSLQRQARKAERYKKYKAEMQDIELWSASHRLLELVGEGKYLRDANELLEQRKADVQGQLDQGETQLEVARVTAATEEQQLSEIQERLYVLDNKIKLNEQNIQFQSHEADDLQQRSAQARQEVSDLRAQISDSEGQLESSRQELEQHGGRREGLARQLDALEQHHRTLRDELSEVHQALQQERGDAAMAERTIAQNEAMGRALVQRRVDVQERLELARDEMDRVVGRTQELGDAARELDQQLDGLHNSVDVLGRRRSEIRARMETLDMEVQRGEAELEVTRDELHRRRAKLDQLKEFERKYEGFSRGTRAVMKRLDGDASAEGVQGLVADKVEAPGLYETALEAVLGQRLGTIIVDNDRVGLEAIEYLKSNAEGRSSFINRFSRHTSVLDRAPVGFTWEPGHDSISASVGGGAAPGLEMYCGEGVHGPMLGLIEIDREYSPVAESLLRDVVVVEDLHAALDRWDQLEDKTLVTLDGEILGPDGTLTGGSIDAELAGVLRKKREVKEQTGIIAELEQQFKDALDRHLSVKTELAGLEQTLEAVTHEGHQSDKEIITREKDLSRISAEMQTLGTRQDELVQDKAKLRRLLEELDQQELRLQAEAEDAGARIHLAGDMVYLLEREELRLAEVTEQSSRAVTDIRVELARVDAHCRSLEHAADRIEELIGERRMRIQRMEQDADEGDARAASLQQQAAQLQQELEQLVTRRASTTDELERRRSAYDAQLGQLGQQELDLKQVRRELAGTSDELSELQIRLSELAMSRRHVEEQIWERHHEELRLVAGDYHMRPPVTEEQVERLEKLRQLIGRMGETNLTAIEEYEELSERHGFLSAQREDLEAALAQLVRAIQKINRTSRRRFKETFDLVNAKFQEIFPRLFNGGRAALSLTDPENLLETGVDIVAQPPGKKLQSIDLLSGGEKALTAVSMIFSMFMVKPTPFCLLDEVDAPLDEANVIRFGDIIKEMSDSSQFIVITHNRRTMEIGDRLYGVTMEDPGISKLVSVNLAEGQSLTDE